MAVDKQLLKQFDEMSTDSQADREYLTAMGVVGLQKAVDDIQKKQPIQNNTKSAYTYNIYNSIASSDNHGEAGTNIGADRDFESIVDKLRSETFHVRIVDALGDIVRPLADRMKLISLEDQQFGLQNHTESLLYYREIVDAINRLGTEIEEGFVNKMVMEYRKFMRNPALSILKGINSMLIQPMTKVIGKVLFGGRERTDTEKIVDSIERMSEFLQRGSIDRRKSLFDRLKEEGVVGTSVTAIGGGVMSGLGMGRGAAQEAEMKKSQGQDLSLREKFALSQYRGEVKQFGRQGGILSNESEQEKETPNIEFPDLDSILDVLRSMSNTLSRIEAFGYDQAGVEHQRYIDAEQFRMTQERGQMRLSSHLEDVIELESEQKKRSKKSFKIQKEQLGEAEETNRKLFMQTIMNALGTVTSTVATLATGLGGGLATLLGLKGLTKGKGGIFGNMFKNMKGGGLGKFLKRIPILGSLIAGGSALSIAMDDDMSGDEKKTAGFGLGGNLLGGLAGAKIGGAIGTAIGGPVGTIIGGIVGAVGGAILGEEAMVAFEEEITSAFNKGKQILIDGWSWVSETYTQVMTSTRKFGHDIGTSIRENLIDPVIELRNGVLKTAMGLGTTLRENIIDPIINFKNEIVNVAANIGASISSIVNKINPFSSDEEKGDNPEEKSIMTKAMSWGAGLFSDDEKPVEKPERNMVVERANKRAAEWRTRIANTKAAQEGSANIGGVLQEKPERNMVVERANKRAAEWRTRIANTKAAQEGSANVSNIQNQPNNINGGVITADYDKTTSINTSRSSDGGANQEEAKIRAQQTLEALKQIGADMKRNAEYQKQQLENSKKTKSGFDSQPSNDTLSVMGG